MKWLNAALIVKYNLRLVASLHEAKDLLNESCQIRVNSDRAGIC